MTDSTDAQHDERNDHLGMTVQIVTAYVANNSVPTGSLADLISSVHQSVLGLGKPVAASDAAQFQVAKATPAQIKKSITDEGLVSFEDGKSYKSLKRHLTGRGLTPHDYRIKHGLPNDYPMTAPGYSARRSELARSIGLGRARQQAVPKSADVAETVTDAPKARGGRRKDSAAAPKPRGRASKAIATAE